MEITNLEETKEYAKSLSEELKSLLKNNCVIVTMNGELGAGKTTLSKYIGEHFGVEQMQSPSYVYIREYDINFGKLVHADLWRVEEQKDFNELGLDKEYKVGNLILIEWPKSFINQTNLDSSIKLISLMIKVDGDTREISRS